MEAVRAATASAAAAFRLLTVLPVPGPGSAGGRGGGSPGRGGASPGRVPGSPAGRPAGAATVWFPLVGLVVGALVCGALLLPLPPLPRAGLALLLSAALTGGLHEDGLMDASDAAFAPASRARRIEILGDPRVGAHGVTAAVTVLLLRFGLFASVEAVGVVVAAVVGRWVMALTLGLAPPGRPTGLGAAHAEGARPGPASVLALLLLLPLGPAAGWGRAAGAVLLGLVAGGAAARVLVGRLGGLNGDGHGACGILAETAALGAFLAAGPVPS